MAGSAHIEHTCHSAGSMKGSPQRRTDDQRALDDIRALCIKVAVIVLFAWVLVGVVFGVAVMEGEDMYPRIRDGDLMFFYRLEREYSVGDVVTFVKDDARYTGRIVAQGGDTVELGEGGELVVNDSVQDEQVFYPTEPLDDSTTLSCEVPEGSVYLLGDFRTNAMDSRTYGPVMIDELDGKIISILRRRGI